MNTPITRAEHNEFVKRMEEEHGRQNNRIDYLERAVEQNNKLLISVERLALSMETMQKEQKDQSDRLEKIEARDGEMWRKVTGHIITSIVGIVVGYIFTQIGM
jgi:hypothetical protein